MSSQSLPVSRLINVAVQLTPAGAQAQSLSNLLLLGTSAVIDVLERYRVYESMEAVAADFSSNSAEYLAALLWFQQAPQPTRLWIGRWAQTSTNGLLRCAPLTPQQQAIANFTAITNGGFTYSRDGGAPVSVAGMNFSAAANLNAVASIITAALTGVTCVWNSNLARFEFSSSLTGASSSISFLSAPSTGTDISALLAGRSTNSGAYVVQGIAAETALAAVQLFDSNYGQAWYAAVVPGASNSDHQAIAAYIEATNTKHMYGYTSQEAGALVAASTTDLPYIMAQAGYDKTVQQYSSSNPYAVVSYLARQMTVDYGGNNTTITLMYKDEPGITPENLNSSQIQALEAKNCNVFVKYNNDTAIVQRGVQASGVFTDTVAGIDWLAVTLQTALYNLLFTSTTKIPQTDAGTQLLATTAEAVCAQGVTNGLLAPGVWNSGGFGQLKQGDYMPKGYYIFAPKVATQNPADRAARRSVPIQIAAKLAGAIHEINVGVTVNQ